MNAKDFDKFLSESAAYPEYVYVHPDIWLGYFWKPGVSRIRHRFFTKLGRFLNIKQIYWIGFPVVFIDGISKLYPEIQTKWLDASEDEDNQNS